jgi:phage repressor protein C with HTH and peptisase S24 domain
MHRMELDQSRLRLMKRIQERKTDLKNASLAIGRNAAYLHQFVMRGTPKVLPEDARLALADFLEIDEQELRHTVAPRRQPRSGGAPSISPDDSHARAKKIPSGYRPVAEIDVRVSAGPGTFIDGPEDAKETWLFPDAIVRHEFRARHEDLRIITIDGDSMEPLLSSGDRILIDSSQKVPVPPGIFVVWDGMGLVAKRVEHIPNSEPPKIVIRSINPEYQTYERTADEVNIVGRVIWTAKRL